MAFEKKTGYGPTIRRTDRPTDPHIENIEMGGPISKEKNIVTVSWKAITLGPPLVIVPYNESVGLTSSDSTFHFPFQMTNAESQERL